ncbi:MAG: NCS2 family nucleobase:cation symporter [Treponema sp.]|jgi:uracil permease|nr:NCS2 family nucleobase:cation symporter [Treponema sp.]
MSEIMLYMPEDRPPIWKNLVYSLQTLLACFSATILVPILVGLPTNVALFSAGLATLIMILITKNKVYTFLGSSFAFIGAFIMVKETYGINYAFGGTISSGIFYCIIALIIAFAGDKWIHKALSPIVIGPTIICIGMSLAPTAISMASTGIDGQYSLTSLSIAGITIVITLIASIPLKKYFGSISVLAGLCITYFIVLVLGKIIPAYNIISFQSFKETPFFYIPHFYIPKFNSTSVLIFIIVSLSTVCEHIGDMTTISNALKRDILINPGLKRTLLGDGIGNIIAGFTGSVANTSYGEATATMIMTRVASTWVTGGAAILAILLSFFGKFGGLLGTLPTPILGGTVIILYGLISSAGLRLLIEKQIDFKETRNVMIGSIIMSIGLGGGILSITLHNTEIKLTSIAFASLIGIILNIILPEKKEHILKSSSLFNR